MHYGIAAIVYAHNEREAMDRASKIFDKLACKSCYKPFDYYSITGLEHDKPAFLASSKGAQEIIASCMQATKNNFMRYLKDLRKGLAAQTDEEIFEQRHPKDFSMDVRWNSYQIGLWRGPGIYLYDSDGEGIREPGHLKDALEKWPTLTDKQTRDRLDSEGDVWVVTADAHS